MRMKFLLAILFIAAVGQAAQAAESTIKLGTFKDWEAYTYKEDGNLVCYMLSHPAKSVGNYTRRGEAYAAIAHRPAEKRLDEISLIAGYTYSAEADVVVKIGKKKFNLFTQADTAWARDAATDHDIAAAMRAGNDMVVEGMSSRGTETIDTYSLAGATAAWRAISKACGVSP